MARRLGCRGRRPPVGRLGAARRARGGDRPAPQHVRPCRQGQPRAPRDGVRRPRGRQVAPRPRVHRRRRALDDPDGTLPAVRRRRHVLGHRGDGEGRRRHHRRRHRRSRQREAQELLWRRGGCRSPRTGVGRARCRRRWRAVCLRDRLGCADLGDGAGRPAAARARVRGHPSSRGADARPDRAPRQWRQGRAAADPLPRAQGPARRAAGVGWGQRARDVDRARGAAARRQRAARRGARGRRVGRADGRGARGRARDDRGQPALHRGDRANAARVRRPVRRHSPHRPGDDLCADRPPAGDRAHSAAARRCRGPRVLVGRDRGARRQPDQRRRAPRPGRA